MKVKVDSPYSIYFGAFKKKKKRLVLFNVLTIEVQWSANAALDTAEALDQSISPLSRGAFALTSSYCAKGNHDNDFFQ